MADVKEGYVIIGQRALTYILTDISAYNQMRYSIHTMEYGCPKNWQVYLTDRRYPEDLSRQRLVPSRYEIVANCQGPTRDFNCLMFMHRDSTIVKRSHHFLRGIARLQGAYGGSRISEKISVVHAMIGQVRTVLWHMASSIIPGVIDFRRVKS